MKKDIIEEDEAHNYNGSHNTNQIYGLNPRDLELISKYTEESKLNKILDSQLHHLNKQIEITRSDPNSLNQAQVTGFRVSDSKELKGCLINRSESVEEISGYGDEGFGRGYAGEVYGEGFGGREDESGILYNGKPVEIKFDKNVGLRKRILEKKYIPRMVRINQTSEDYPYQDRPIRNARKPKGPKKSKTRKSGKKGVSKSSRVKTEKERRAFLENRKKINAKYTKIAPKISKRVRTEIRKKSYHLNGRRSVDKITRQNMVTEDEINPYVIEQIKAKILKARKQKRHMRGDTAVDLEEFEQLESSANESVRTETNLSRLRGIIDMMDICLSSSSNGFMGLAGDSGEGFLRNNSVGVQVEGSGNSEKANSAIPDFGGIQSDKRSINMVSKVKKKKIGGRNSHPMKFEPKNPKKSKNQKSEKNGRKKVKLIEREYELDFNSHEVSDLVNHMPSQVLNLNKPIIKEDDLSELNWANRVKKVSNGLARRSILDGEERSAWAKLWTMARNHLFFNKSKTAFLEQPDFKITEEDWRTAIETAGVDIEALATTRIPQRTIHSILEDCGLKFEKSDFRTERDLESRLGRNKWRVIWRVSNEKLGTDQLNRLTLPGESRQESGFVGLSGKDPHVVDIEDELVNVVKVREEVREFEVEKRQVDAGGDVFGGSFDMDGGFEAGDGLGDDFDDLYMDDF